MNALKDYRLLQLRSLSKQSMQSLEKGEYSVYGSPFRRIHSPTKSSCEIGKKDVINN